MNKTIKFTVSIIFIILIIAGAYLWYSNREMQGSMQDYKIIMSSEGTMIENKKAGFSFKAPSGWEAGIVEGIQGAAMFALPGTEGADGTSGINSDTPLSDGCLIEATVVYNKRISFEEMKEELEELYEGFEASNLQMEEINGKKYLKNYWEVPYLGFGIADYFKSNNNVYNFALYYPIDADEDQKNQCINDFDEFLETIVIEDK